MPKYKNNRALVMDILRGRWLISAPEARRLYQVANDFLERKPVSAEVEDIRPLLMDLDGATQVGDSPSTSDRMVLVVPVTGTLTKYDNCYGTSTLEVAAILDEYRVRENIVGFVLDFDSPGGTTDSVMPLVAAIRRIQADGKPIIAHCDYAASAAYWVASQCDALFMDNLLSEVGSIGVYAQIVDDRENKQTGRRTLEIYAPESSDKNRAYRDALDGKPEAMKAELSEIARVFQEAVKEGRKNLKADAPGVLSGATFSTAKAIDNGMADGMAELEDCVQNVFLRSHEF